MGKHINPDAVVDRLNFDNYYQSASLNPKNAKHRAFIAGDRVSYVHSSKGYLEGYVTPDTLPYTGYQGWPLVLINGNRHASPVDPKRLTLVQSTHAYVHVA